MNLVRTSTKIKNIKTEIESIKENQSEMKNKLREMKNTLQGITSGVVEAEHQIINLEPRKQKTPNQNSKNKKKRI